MKLVVITIFIGLFIGTCVAIATKVFVNSILYLTDIRENTTFFLTSILGYQINYAPIVTILIAALIINFIKKKIQTGYPQFGKIKLRKDEILKVYPKISKAKKILKWQPKIKFESGLISTIRWYQNAK